MPEPAIPVHLLVEQVEFSIAFAEKMAHMSAQLLRESRIGWTSADDDLWKRECEIDTVSRVVDQALTLGGGDLLPARDALRENGESAKARIKALCEELRRSCLMNGPLTPKREAA